MIYSA
ncbi:hypothetical protein YPPY48_2079, partial [Yersinia pestis PY-48]